MSPWTFPTSLSHLADARQICVHVPFKNLGAILCGSSSNYGDRRCGKELRPVSDDQCQPDKTWAEAFKGLQAWMIYRHRLKKASKPQ